MAEPIDPDWGALLIRSEVLDAEVWLVRDPEQAQEVRVDGKAVFFASEIELLKEKTPDQLRDIHEAKLVFPGSRSVTQEKVEADIGAERQDASMIEAAEWLKERLSPGARQVSALIAEWTGGNLAIQRNGTMQWEGGEDGKGGHTLDNLMRAGRGVVQVETFFDSGVSWWRLPREVHDKSPVFSCAEVRDKRDKREKSPLIRGNSV